MATIPTSLTADPQAFPADLTATELYGAGSTRGRFKIWAAVLIPIVVALVGGIAWAAAARARGATELAAINKFIVAPQTFNVALKEKGELKASESKDIKCEVEGKSTIISLIPEGAAVKEGDLLVELASDEIENRIRQEELKEANVITAYEANKAELDIQRDKNASDIRKAELQIELKRLELEKYEKGEWEQRLNDAKIAIEQATISLDRRREDFAAAKELRAKNFITKTQYDEDEFAFKRAEWELEKAKMARSVLETYTHVADLRQRQSDVEEAVKESERVKKNAEAEESKKVGALEGRKKELDLTQDQLAKLRTQKAKCRITAPTPGFVVYYAENWRWGSDSQIKEGSQVHEQQILLSLPDTSEMKVVVRVHETKTARLHVGQRAVVNVEGVPDRQFTGTVSKIAVLADSQNRWLNPDLKEYETEITLDPVDIPLKPGVTAHAEILVETVENRLAIPVQSVYSKGGRRYVFRADGADVIPTEVEMGPIGTEWVEVASGLKGGEQVLMNFSDEHKRLIPDVIPGARPNGVTPVGPGLPPDKPAGKPSPKGKPPPKPASP
jgi:HlyD family secretion protein